MTLEGGWPTSFHYISSKTTQSLTFYGILSPTILPSGDTRSAKSRLLLTRNSQRRGVRLSSRRLVDLDNNFAIDPRHRHPKLNVRSAWPQCVIAPPSLVLGEIVHDKIRVDA